jgi:predicted CopG family antitoxin
MIRIATPCRLRLDLHALPRVEPSATGERQIWIEEVWVNRLAALRQFGESYSDVILRLIEQEAQSTLSRRSAENTSRSRSRASLLASAP